MIRILCADLSRADGTVYQRLYENASEERKRRADRYRGYGDKLRCVAADALLKAALGAGEFQIGKNEYGKPFVKGRTDFHYNLSHSGKYAVIAFGESEVGVDIQEHREGTDMRLIAEQCFSPEEKAYVFADGGRTERRFYGIWTGKESYLKYIGKGLYQDMRSFSIWEREREIRRLYPEEGYTLSLCTDESEYTFDLLDIRQLI